ncbi:hypothetical protein CYMTET_56849 [Cymbomonas tetramitiformis]|uniref:Kinesin light chain n=1 Tax=Cymbomonas tetramitiformis TaxID=36881 RepID=A0AAE0ENC9_9CHLO|nr:hypothetical protein CYMTET_56849 [Cymbomonas tetramitiformis]
MGCGSSIENLEYDIATLPSEGDQICKFVEMVCKDGATPYEVPVGLSLSFLEKFFNHHRLHDLTTAEVVEKIIRPATKSLECSYLELFRRSGIEGNSLPQGLRHGGVAGNATHFVSHAWSNKFRDVVSALRAFTNLQANIPGQEPAPVFFYMDIFAINQHQVLSYDASQFAEMVENVIAKVGKALVVATPWHQPKAFGRLWCLYELFCAIQNQAEISLCFPYADLKVLEKASPEDTATLFRRISDIDSRGARTTLEDDKERLIEVIDLLTPTSGASEEAEQDGGLSKCNEVVVGFLQKLLFQRFSDRLQQLEDGQLSTEEILLYYKQMAKMYSSCSKREEAVKVLRDVVTRSEEAFGVDSIHLCDPLTQLAVELGATGEVAEALPLHQRALAIRQQVFGDEHQEVANSLSYLAEHAFAQSNYDVAKPMYLRILQIRQRTLDPDHPEVAASLSKVAHIHRHLGEFAQAEECYRRALNIQEKVHGKESVMAAATLNNLAVTIEKQGRHQEAAKLYTDVLLVWEQTCGAFHPSVAATLTNMTSLLKNQGSAESTRVFSCGIRYPWNSPSAPGALSQPPHPSPGHAEPPLERLVGLALLSMQRHRQLRTNHQHLL